MNKLSLACLAAGLFALTTLPASAELSSGDKEFMQKAANGGLAEVQLAQLAQQRASAAQVRQFASRMATDHGQANTELQQIAEQANVTLPTKPTGKEASTAQRLSGLNGSSFDQAYAQAMLNDHQEDVALFRKEASSGKDPALKAFAQKTLPVLQRHLQMAQGLNIH